MPNIIVVGEDLAGGEWSNGEKLLRLLDFRKKPLYNHVAHYESNSILRNQNAKFGLSFGCKFRIMKFNIFRIAYRNVLDSPTYWFNAGSLNILIIIRSCLFRVINPNLC